MVYPIPCPVCGLRYADEIDLRKHLRFNKYSVFHKIPKALARKYKI